MTSRCRKFEPNIFNKLKCQNCFSQKDQHCAEALEKFKEARKVSKAGYLFVAPELDFSDPVDRSKRWQRRFFVLYDDGELVYLVDENPDTIPQDRINMNKCRDVLLAESLTSHQFSMCIETTDRTHYVKGTTQDEIQRWFDVLVMYPRSQKIKHKRPPTCPVKTPLPQQRYGGVGGDAAKEEGATANSSSTATDRKSRFNKHRSDPGFRDGIQKSRSMHDVPGYEEVQQAQRHTEVQKSTSGVFYSDNESSYSEESGVEDGDDEELEPVNVMDILRHGTTGKADLWRPTAVSARSMAERRRQERESGKAALSPSTRSALRLISSSFPSYDEVQTISTAVNDQDLHMELNMTDESKIANSSLSSASPRPQSPDFITETRARDEYRTPPECLSPASSTVFHPDPDHNARSKATSEQISTKANARIMANSSDAMVMEVLEAQVTSLKTQLKNSHDEMITMREKNLSLEAKVKSLQNQPKSSMHRPLKDNSAQSTASNSRNDQLEQRLKDAQRRLSDTQTELQRVNKELQAVRLCRENEAQNAMAEIVELKRKHEQVIQKMKESSSNQSDSKSRGLKEKNEIIASLEKRIQQFEKELTVQTSKNKDETESLLQEISHYSTLSKTTQNELASVRKLLEQKEDIIQQLQSQASLSSRHDESPKMIEVLQRRCSELELKLQKQTTVTPDTEMPQILSNLNTQIERLAAPTSAILKTSDGKYTVTSNEQIKREVKEIFDINGNLLRVADELRGSWLHKQQTHRRNLEDVKTKLDQVSKSRSLRPHDLDTIKSVMKELDSSIMGIEELKTDDADLEQALVTGDVYSVLADSMSWLRTQSDVRGHSSDIRVTQLQAGLGLCRDTLQKARSSSSASVLRRLVSDSLQVCQTCLQQQVKGKPDVGLVDHLAKFAGCLESQLNLYARLRVSLPNEIRVTPIEKQQAQMRLQLCSQQLQQALTPTQITEAFNNYAETVLTYLRLLCDDVRSKSAETDVERTPVASPTIPSPTDTAVESVAGSIYSEDSFVPSSMEEEAINDLTTKLKRYKREVERLRRQLQLSQAALENASIYHQLELERADTEHDQELDELCEQHDSEVEILRKALREAKRRLGPESEDIMDIATLKYELEKSKTQLEELIKEEQADEDSVAHYKHKLEAHSEEIISLKAAHRQELEKIQQTIHSTMQLLGESDGDESAGSLRRKLEQEQQTHRQQVLRLEQRLNSLESSLTGSRLCPDPLPLSDDNDVTERIRQMENKILYLQEQYESELDKKKEKTQRELSQSRDDILHVLQAAQANSVAIDENLIRNKYEREIHQVKSLCEQGVSELEQSHNLALREMRKAHIQEIGELRKQSVQEQNDDSETAIKPEEDKASGRRTRGVTELMHSQSSGALPRGRRTGETPPSYVPDRILASSSNRPFRRTSGASEAVTSFSSSSESSTDRRQQTATAASAVGGSHVRRGRSKKPAQAQQQQQGQYRGKRRDMRRSQSTPGLAVAGVPGRSPAPRGSVCLDGPIRLTGVSVAERMRKFEHKFS